MLTQIGFISVAGMNPENKFGGSFGSNEWLVDEMYERFLADPNSVGDDWKAFFSDYKPGDAKVATPQANVPPIPKPQNPVSYGYLK